MTARHRDERTVTIRSDRAATTTSITGGRARCGRGLDYSLVEILEIVYGNLFHVWLVDLMPFLNLITYLIKHRPIPWHRIPPFCMIGAKHPSKTGILDSTLLSGILSASKIHEGNVPQIRADKAGVVAATSLPRENNRRPPSASKTNRHRANLAAYNSRRKKLEAVGH